MTSSGSSMEESHSRGATERPSPTQHGLAYIQPSIDANASRLVEPFALPTRESGFTNQTDPGGQSWRISEPHLGNEYAALNRSSRKDNLCWSRYFSVGRAVRHQIFLTRPNPFG
jgi:hypothetical protein